MSFPAASPAPAALELLHPDGVAPRRLLLGGNSFAWLHPNARGSEQADLVVLSPSAAECRRPGWLENASAEAAGRLAERGVVYVMAPPRWRAPLRLLLAQRGLACGSPVAHLPDWFNATYLAPAVPGAMLHALSHSAHTWFRRMFPRALARPGVCRAVATVLPYAGFPAFRKEGPPPFHWLNRFDPAPGNGPPLIYSSRYGSGPPVLLRFSGLRLASVAKINAAGDAAELACITADAGIVAPRPVREGALGPGRIRVQTAVPGRPAAVLLASRPARLPALLAQVAGWLNEWNSRTRHVSPVGPERLWRELTAAADVLRSALPPGAEDYHSRLARACAAAAERSVPSVAAHNDLTMWNVLLGPACELGVIDWENAAAESWPLTDLFYAALDAAAAASGYADRRQSFLECFGRRGKHALLVRNCVDAAVERLSLPPLSIPLCFHACWLRHAANELRSGRGQGEFVQIWRDAACGFADGEEWRL